MEEFLCRNINQPPVTDALRGGGCDVLVGWLEGGGGGGVWGALRGRVEANWREGRASCLRPAATSLGDTQTQRHSDTQTHVADTLH